MTAKQLIAAGQLTAALRQVTEDVRGDPGNTRLRISLFELLCFSGDLERARKQLEIIGQNDIEAELAVHRYRQLLVAEIKRRECFASGLRPKLIAPASFAGMYFAALDQFREGNFEKTAELLEQAEEDRSLARASINGVSVDDFKDGDDLLGAFAEVMIQDDYCWLSWESVISISFSKPKYLRDLMWLPVEIELPEGSGGEAFMPVVYAGSYLDASDQIKLGRETRWRADIEVLSVGLGQKTLAAGGEDYPLLEIEKLEVARANAHAK